MKVSLSTFWLQYNRIIKLHDHTPEAYNPQHRTEVHSKLNITDENIALITEM